MHRIRALSSYFFTEAELCPALPYVKMLPAPGIRLLVLGRCEICPFLQGAELFSFLFCQASLPYKNKLDPGWENNVLLSERAGQQSSRHPLGSFPGELSAWIIFPETAATASQEKTSLRHSAPSPPWPSRVVGVQPSGYNSGHLSAGDPRTLHRWGGGLTVLVWERHRSHLAGGKVEAWKDLICRVSQEGDTICGCRPGQAAGRKVPWSPAPVPSLHPIMFYPSTHPAAHPHPFLRRAPTSTD